MKPSRLHSFIFHLSWITTFFTFFVILLGAYVRLKDAGLGCPDWPGCYGRWIVPNPEEVALSHPETLFHAGKAWKEMVHRYLATSVGMLVIVILVLSIVIDRSRPRRWLLPIFTFLWVGFQGMLGRWTVTLKVHPFVVMMHLLGGILTLVLIWAIYLRMRRFLNGGALVVQQQIKSSFNVNAWVLVGICLLLLQILLGGWMSANYASLACPDFPTCQGRWWPDANYHDAFTVWQEIAPHHNYEGGKLDNQARVAIHWMHRLGAVIVFTYLLILALRLISQKKSSYSLAFLLLGFLVLQIGLGISNVVFRLPLLVAVFHNGVAALLVLVLVTLFWMHRRQG